MLNLLTLWNSHVVQATKINMIATAVTIGGRVGPRPQVCLHKVKLNL